MTFNELKDLSLVIVAEAYKLHLAHTSEREVSVNYVCIFTQSLTEYNDMVTAIQNVGYVADNTATGPVFYIDSVLTDVGAFRLLKIRRCDAKRPERGDADFTVINYNNFKKTYLDKSGFSLIKRPQMEMIELIDPAFNVLAYYSHPTLMEVLKLK